MSERAYSILMAVQGDNNGPGRYDMGHSRNRVEFLVTASGLDVEVFEEEMHPAHTPSLGFTLTPEETDRLETMLAHHRMQRHEVEP